MKAAKEKESMKKEVGTKNKLSETEETLLDEELAGESCTAEEQVDSDLEMVKTFQVTIQNMNVKSLLLLKTGGGPIEQSIVTNTDLDISLTMPLQITSALPEKQVNTFSSTRKHTHTHAHAHIHSHAHIRTHTYTRAHTHT